MNATHLSVEAHDALGGSREERIEFVRREHYIEYASGEQILNELQDLLTYPKSIRMPCVALIGDAENGKSTLQQQFMQRNPTTLDAAGYPTVPVVWVEMPSKPSEARLWSEILRELSIPHRTDWRAERLEPLALEALLARRVKAIALDEFHNMLHGTAREQREFLAVVKRLCNSVGVPIIASGVVDVLRALATDPQFVTRFQKLQIPRWQATEEFLRLLTSFEELIPLPEPSGLASPEFSFPIFKACRGTIGGVKNIVVDAAVKAIRDGQSRITYKLLTSAIEDYRSHSISTVAAG